LIDKETKTYEGKGKEVDMGGNHPLDYLKPDKNDPN